MHQSYFLSTLAIRPCMNRKYILSIIQMGKGSFIKNMDRLKMNNKKFFFIRESPTPCACIVPHHAYMHFVHIKQWLPTSINFKIFLNLPY